MSKFPCQACGVITPVHDIVHFGSAEDEYRDLCTACFNTEMAARAGLTRFEIIRFEPVGIEDCDGAIHEFHFQARLLVGRAEEELFGLLGRLVQKIQRTLAVKHVVDEGRGHQIVDTIVRGPVEWDDAEEGRVPQVLVDGLVFI